jgi:hypothetical protein
MARMRADARERLRALAKNALTEAVETCLAIGITAAQVRALVHELLPQRASSGAVAKSEASNDAPATQGTLLAEEEKK